MTALDDVRHAMAYTIAPELMSAELMSAELSAVIAKLDALGVTPAERQDVMEAAAKVAMAGGVAEFPHMVDVFCRIIAQGAVTRADLTHMETHGIRDLTEREPHMRTPAPEDTLDSIQDLPGGSVVRDADSNVREVILSVDGTTRRMSGVTGPADWLFPVTVLYVPTRDTPATWQHPLDDTALKESLVGSERIMRASESATLFSSAHGALYEHQRQMFPVRQKQVTAALTTLSQRQNYAGTLHARGRKAEATAIQETVEAVLEAMEAAG